LCDHRPHNSIAVLTPLALRGGLVRAQNLEGLYLMGFDPRKVRAHPRYGKLLLCIEHLSTARPHTARPRIARECEKQVLTTDCSALATQTRVLEYYRGFSSSTALRRTAPVQQSASLLRPSSTSRSYPSSSTTTATTRPSAGGRGLTSPAATNDEEPPLPLETDLEADERQYREAWADEDEVTWE
jgi:hypothetical protein